MKASQYTVVALPKLDTETDIQKLRDRYEAHWRGTQPHVPLVAPFTPVNIDDLLSITEYISQARRNLHPIAAAFRECVERGDLVVMTCMEGGEAITELRAGILGSRPVSFVSPEGGFEPLLVLGPIPDPGLRSQAMLDARRIGRTVALIDAITLLRIEPGNVRHNVARFPFGIGRVDYYEKLIS